MQLIRDTVLKFQEIPNVGKATEKDLLLLGFTQPIKLAGQDPFEMYSKLCHLQGQRIDPCVIDVFIAAVRYMEGGPAKKWWEYTAKRKQALRNS